MKDAASPPLLSPLSSAVSAEKSTGKGKTKSSSSGTAASEKETIEQASARFEIALERDYFMTGASIPSVCVPSFSLKPFGVVADSLPPSTFSLIAEEALDFGIIDRIVENRSTLGTADKS